LGFLANGYTVTELQVPATMPGQVALRHAEVKVAKGTASLVFPARGGVSIDVEHSLRPDHFRAGRRLAARARSVLAHRPFKSEFWR
jgi:hypothetical protein